MVNLVLQSFGRENEFNRAILTVLSFYAYSSFPISETQVILFTDQPSYFDTYLKSLPVKYFLLTQEKIKEMRGDIDFIHRMKIASIEEAFLNTEGILLYADSDTFFFADPTPLIKELSPGISSMHVKEFTFESLRNLEMPAGKTARAFLNLIESKEFKLANGTNIKFSSMQYSWNAGVMMFHPAQQKFIPDVYSLTDQFYPTTANHACEQFAFSLMLQNNTVIKPCNSFIYHYWYRVKKLIVDQFLEGQIDDKFSKMKMSDKLKLVRNWCQMFPDYFEGHNLFIKDKAIQAFNKGHFLDGYIFSVKALFRLPFDMKFMRDVFFHTKRLFKI